MPTTKRRHAVTETEAVAAALERAAQRWPEDRGHPARLLSRLIRAGADAIAPAVESVQEERRAAILRGSGALTGIYPEGYLAELREDWPA